MTVPRHLLHPASSTAASSRSDPISAAATSESDRACTTSSARPSPPPSSSSSAPSPPSSSSSSSPSPSSSSSLLPRVASGSVGSIVTALAVTPLEVVKVRQQASASLSSLSPSFPPGGGVGVGVMRCRGCGTFVLNNGLMDCVLPRSSVPYFDAAAAANARTTKADAIGSGDGTFSVLRRIFRSEGIGGIYAGLAPTLVMSVPNTVLYFTAYDEITGRLRSRLRRRGGASDDDDSAPSTEGGSWSSSSSSSSRALEDAAVPLMGGSAARLIASAVTSPLELVRTRQASIVGSGDRAPPRGMMDEFRRIMKTEGLKSLYRGAGPTLWRDVPFSAVYWMCLERFKSVLRRSDLPVLGGAAYAEDGGGGTDVPPLLQARQAFASGAAAGMIAAMVTTPFDVVKTRRQMVPRIEEGAAAICDHGGAVAYRPPRGFEAATTGGEAAGGGEGTIARMRYIAYEEGLSALWRGNVTRMIKVAPACAIMISCYELGKRVLGPG